MQTPTHTQLQKHTPTNWTHSNIVDGHAHRSMVIDLLCGDGLGLIGQEDAKQQQ